jgi:hypothetical protein
MHMPPCHVCGAQGTGQEMQRTGRGVQAQAAAAAQTEAKPGASTDGCAPRMAGDAAHACALSQPCSRSCCV